MALARVRDVIATAAPPHAAQPLLILSRRPVDLHHRSRLSTAHRSAHLREPWACLPPPFTSSYNQLLSIVYCVRNRSSVRHTSIIDTDRLDLRHLPLRGIRKPG